MSELASRTAIDEALSRADAPEAKAVFTLRLDDDARRNAAAAACSHGRFAGVPITVKDNFDLAGYPTTAGSKFLASAAPAGKDAPVIARLRQAGFVILGRTNMTEFAFSGLGLNPHYGTPVNPAFPGEQRIPGGSSSGAAVSVALGIVPVAIGTDTGGSIRIPAALCGLTGFKPTAESVTREGVLPLSTTLDGVGVIARSVAECAAVFDVIRDVPGSPRGDIAAGDIRLGIVTTYVQDDVEPYVALVTQAAIDRLEAAGIRIERIAIPELADIPAMMRDATFPAVEAAGWHASLLVDHAEDYDPRVLVRIRAGQIMAPAAYARLCDQREGLIEAVTARAAGFDALVWPTVPFAAPTMASLADDGAYHAANGRSLRNSTVANLIDGCAISIPCPTQAAPVGMTLAALHGRDDHLLRVATSLQSILEGA